MINQTSSLNYVNKKSFKFSKVSSENTYLISVLAFTFGMAVTVILLSIRGLSMLFAGDTIEED